MLKYASKFSVVLDPSLNINAEDIWNQIKSLENLKEKKSISLLVGFVNT